MLYVRMSERRPEDLHQSVIEFARAVDAPEDSFLLKRLSLGDAEGLQSIIDGITLALISFCYHRHPRVENFYEVMELLESGAPGSKDALDIAQRAGDAETLQSRSVVR